MKRILDGVVREITVERTERGFAVTIDGRCYDVRDVSAAGGTLAFLIGHGSYVAHVSDGGAGTLVSIGGRTYALARDEADSDHPVGAHAHGGDGRLEAPMPGSIVAVNVAPGDPVRAGQPVIVLESMKMHNEIAAPMDGVVRRLHCKVGEQVPFGRLLAEIGAD